MTHQTIAGWGFVAIAIILIGFAALILWKIFSDKQSLSGLIAEPPLPGQDPNDTKASLSRLQFLIFTFVIGGIYLLLCIESGSLIDIPVTVLALLGISGGTYLVAKTVASSERKADTQASADSRKRVR